MSTASSSAAAVSANPIPPVVKPARFRAGMSYLSGACTIIASRLGEARAGLTATAVCSVTADPPRLLVCLNREGNAHEVISRSGVLSVNVLNAGHLALAQRFAGMMQGVRSGDRFLEGHWQVGVTGVPLLADALVAFECRVVEEIPASTHNIFLCEVIDVTTSGEDASPLLYFNHHFRRLEV